MATSHYFQSGIPGGRSSEQNLVEDLIIECLRIYGFDTFYMPRQSYNEDAVLGEDPLSQFNVAYPLEMYMENVDGFTGDGDLMSKFGVEIRDSATFIVARKRWDETVARQGKAVLTTRPAEGDIVYFPLTGAFMEIKRVEATNPFFQVGKLYVYKLECELFQYSSERFNTGNSDIDNLSGDKSLDILSNHSILLEDGTSLLLEFFTPSIMINEDYTVESTQPNLQNETFTNEVGILDFTEHNPFGEVLQ
jgi:hypothetical protein